jgi:integrase
VACLNCQWRPEKPIRQGQAPIAANRHIQFMKAGWNWAAQRHDNFPLNPCEKVTLNAQKARDRYVTDVEMAAYKGLWSRRSFLPLSMELAYLCRLRANEVFKIRKGHIETRGLRVFRGKGSKGEITKWNDRLRKAADSCLAWHPNATAITCCMTPTAPDTPSATTSHSGSVSR